MRMLKLGNKKSNCEISTAHIIQLNFQSLHLELFDVYFLVDIHEFFK